MIERAQREYVAPYFLGIVSLALGEEDQAFELLNQAFKERTLVVPLKPYVENEPAFVAFRSDPRIEELLERLGFEA